MILIHFITNVDLFTTRSSTCCRLVSGVRLETNIPKDGSTFKWFSHLVEKRYSMAFPVLCKTSLKIPKGQSVSYIEEEQIAQWPKEKVQKDKQRSTKPTYKTKDRVKRTPLRTGELIRVYLCFRLIKTCDWKVKDVVLKPNTKYWWDMTSNSSPITIIWQVLVSTSTTSVGGTAYLSGAPMFSPF
jgi:hypothetical protein